MSGFDIDAMKRAIAQCDENIKVFEKAIEKEQNTKMEYKRIVRELEFQKQNPPKVSVEIVRGSDVDLGDVE